MCVEMKNKQIYNPYLPQFEYIPDGEPHVFGNRVYIYGSHDRFGGKKFCMNDYVCYSASVTDLTDWKYEGTIYSRTEDPRMADGTHQLWAPDVVEGKDGRYYLYYCPDDKIHSIGVAVCDSPAGKYRFYGIVQDGNGRYIGEREGDTIAFDPGVFVDDDGSIYLYSGNGPRVPSAVGREPKGSRVMRLKDDMITIAEEPRKLLPVMGEDKGTGFEGHSFFEASSIRKINGRYYLVYSSYNLHELCYAVSDYPDRDFRYGGVIISNCDIFPGTERNVPRNTYGNNHGGIERINGEYYIFYHRQTNRSMFSRQGCAEQIQILPDGTIPQVETTSQGLNGKPLAGAGRYPAAIACNLYGKKIPTISHHLAMGMRHPYFTQDGEDFDRERLMKYPEEKIPKQYIANGKNGMTAVYRYFYIEKVGKISVTVRGRMHGKLVICTIEGGPVCGEILLTPSKQWKIFTGNVRIPEGKQTLYFCYEGHGKLDFLDFSLIQS